MSWDVEALEATEPLACRTIRYASIFSVTELWLSWLWSVSHDLAFPATLWDLGQTRDPACEIWIEHTDVYYHMILPKRPASSNPCIWVDR